MVFRGIRSIFGVALPSPNQHSMAFPLRDRDNAQLDLPLRQGGVWLGSVVRWLASWLEAIGEVRVGQPSDGVSHLIWRASDTSH